MLALTLTALALLRGAIHAPTARPAVGTRRTHGLAMAEVSTEPRVVGQVAESNPTESFSGKLCAPARRSQRQRLPRLPMDLPLTLLAPLLSHRYDGKKEVAPIWGGLRIGTRRLVVVTGASSGLGLWAAKALADKGNYFVICAVRNPAKMDQAAKEVRDASRTLWTPYAPPSGPPAIFKLINIRRWLLTLTLTACAYRLASTATTTSR